MGIAVARQRIQQSTPPPLSKYLLVYQCTHMLGREIPLGIFSNLQLETFDTFIILN